MNIETQNIEFKSSWRDEYLNVICAFANSDGGILFIGLDDNGKPVEVKNLRKLLEDIPNKIRNKMGIIASVEVENREGIDIIKVTIKKQPNPISYDGGFYVRSGSANFYLNGNELVDFILKEHGRGWDDFVEDGADIYDIDNDTVEKFKRYSIDRIPSISSEKDTKVILEKLNLYSNGKFKRAAILLFGKDPQKFHPSAYLKIGKFLSETDILTSDVVKGNLFEQLDNSLEMLRAKYLLSPIKFEGIHRREILEYPYKALRESLLNALIHRNYLGTSMIQIRLYEDRIIFMNEGKLPPEVPQEKLKTKHLSKPRNALLADIFYKAGFIESWGRGTLEVLKHCREQGLPEPDFFEDSGVFNAILYKSKLEEIIEEDRKTIDKANERDGKITREETEKKIIDLITENPKITTTILSLETGLTQKGVEWNISKLKENGIIRRIGSTKSGYWKVKKIRT